jgi:hypothetical protein
VLEGLGITVTGGNTVAVKLADGSLTVDASGLKVGDLSAVYLTLTKYDASFFEYNAGASNTLHTVTHNLGSKYPMVQVIDPATDTVITPQEIKFVDTNSLTVTLATSALIKVVVQGKKV